MLTESTCIIIVSSPMRCDLGSVVFWGIFCPLKLGQRGESRLPRLLWLIGDLVFLRPQELRLFLPQGGVGILV